MKDYFYYITDMKYLLTLLILLLGNQAFACRCSFPSPIDGFTSGDFVGRIKIIKVYPNHDNEELYKADVEILEYFKGPKITSIFIAGRSDGKIGSSCAVFYPEGSDLLVVAANDRNGKLRFGMCSFKIDFKNNSRSDLRNLEVIRAMSAYDSTFTGKFNSIISSNFSEFLETRKGITLSEKFAIFEVTLDDRVNPSQVKVVKGFDSILDDEIINELLNSTWKIKFYRSDYEIEGVIKVIVPVYYYPKQDEYDSFISINAV